MKDNKKDVKNENTSKPKDTKQLHEIELLHADNAKLVNENADLKEKNLRVQADLINYRNRKEKETQDLLKYANEDIILELLQIGRAHV